MLRTSTRQPPNPTVDMFTRTLSDFGEVGYQTAMMHDTGTLLRPNPGHFNIWNAPTNHHTVPHHHQMHSPNTTSKSCFCAVTLSGVMPTMLPHLWHMLINKQKSADNETYRNHIIRNKFPKRVLHSQPGSDTIETDCRPANQPSFHLFVNKDAHAKHSNHFIPKDMDVTRIWNEEHACLEVAAKSHLCRCWVAGMI